MSFDQLGGISTLNGGSLTQVDKFTYLLSSVSYTENDINTRLAKASTAIDRLSVIWKSDLSDKIKHNFFQAVVVSILLYGCTNWALTKRIEKKLDGNYTRMLWAILSKSWRCLWCNGYRRRKWTRRHEFKSWTRLIAFSHSTNTLGKGMNPIILPLAMGK